MRTPVVAVASWQRVWPDRHTLGWPRPTAGSVGDPPHSRYALRIGPRPNWPHTRGITMTMKIYTKTGDAGETGLFGGGRVPKDHARIDAYGTLDELNASIGVARSEANRATWQSESDRDSIDSLLSEAQNRLFDLGAELATPDLEGKNIPALAHQHVEALETAIDRHEEHLPPLKEFILPCGSAMAAQLHLARCVCRRAERRMVTLAATEPIRELPVRYVNRLSDLLFVLARAANRAASLGDTPWSKPGDGKLP